MTRHWEPGVSYSVGELLEYQGQSYKVIQGHSSQSDWVPGVGTAALFEHLGSSRHHEAPQQHYEPPQQHHEPPQEHHEPGHEPRHESHHEPHHEPRHEPHHEHPQVPAQRAEPLNSLENTLTSRFNSSDGRDRWLRDARQRTDEYLQDGPRAPTTWVLTSGHEVPDYAIEAGVEGGNTLFVARAYVEDGLYVGKAGKHLSHGAEIGRQHKSHALTEYEILLGDPQAIRWVEANGVPNPHDLGARHVDAGVDVHGHQIFVVQVSHNGGIHPARANGGASGAYLAYGDEELAFQEYRVLCYA